MGQTQENTYPIRWITQQIAIGYAPHSQADMDSAKAQGIAAVLNLCAECYGLHEIEAAAGFELHWLPWPMKMRQRSARRKRHWNG